MSATNPPTALPPMAIEAEEALLGCILIDSDALPTLRALKPEDFYRNAHATIFRTMRQLDEDGLAVDSVTVLTRLERTGLLEAAGGSGYVLGLVNAAPTWLNAPYYADMVKQASEGRQVLHLAQDLVTIGYRSDDPARAAVRAIESLAAATASDDEGLELSPEEASARLAATAPAIQRLDALLAEDIAPTRWIVPDLLPEGLTLLAAKPKLGKSWMALGLALAVASGGLAFGSVPVEQGDVFYLALEDSFQRLHQRSKQLLCTASAPTRLEVATAWPRLDEGGLRFLDLWLQAHPQARLIILDTLAKIRGQARHATLYGDDYASLEDVQKLAHAHHVAILVIHHTGKESREDPLDEVNATQGLNGVADNILVLRRERGKPTATLIGDGRELTGSERALAFDLSAGGWRLTEPPADQPKTPERAEILDLLKASAEPMSPKQIAEALDRNPSTIRTMLIRMAQAGDIKVKTFGKYTTVDFVDFVDAGDSSLIKKDEKKDIPTLFDEKGHSPEAELSTKSTKSTVVQESAAKTMQDDSAAPTREGGACADRLGGAASSRDLQSPGAADEPPADFLRFVQQVAEITHSRIDPSSIRRVLEDGDDGWRYTRQPGGR